MDPDIITIRFNHVVFGASSSPFLLHGVFYCNLSSFQNVVPEFVKIMSQSYYVDDLELSYESIDAVYSRFCKARERMLKGGFTLWKWNTNDIDLRNTIEENEG